LEDYINADYANKISDFLTETTTSDLKKRKVKHYGYEFRYGTNDCDVGQPLADRMPSVVQGLIQKMLQDRLITAEPDQLTVNFYEPGSGIAPHVDNPNAFDEFIVSLSLLSSTMMEFRNKKSKQLVKLYLALNSLLVMGGDSRYKWSHSIPERKHDLLQNANSNYLVKPRGKRISLTFRKVKPYDGETNTAAAASDGEPEMTMPRNELEASEFEKSYVHTVYNKISDHFSSTRHTPWPGVVNFIQSMSQHARMLDVGCGNGKYLNLRNDLFPVGF
jgi:alkylated DNA repair protein alkB family protein 8